MRYVFYYLILVNLISLVLCWIDKRASIRGDWRVRESTLLLCAALGGAAGLYLGMRALRHKTRHLKFTLLVPLFLLLQIAVLFWLVPQLRS